MRHLAIAAVVVAAAAPTGSAPTFPPLQREPVLETMLPAANPVVRMVRGATIRFAPRQPTGLHLHPASTVGVVTEGSFLFQPKGEALRTLRTGDVFFEPAGHVVLHFDNASASRPAAITVFYLVDNGNRPLITMLDQQEARAGSTGGGR